jgi:hypothetical protein
MTQKGEKGKKRKKDMQYNDQKRTKGQEMEEGHAIQ